MNEFHARRDRLSARLQAAIWPWILVLAVSAPGSEELSEDHLAWPEDVYRWSYRLIATADEMATLDTLQGEARRRYFDVFWKRRDPTPTTDENEFKEQFAERVDYARTRFSVRAQPEPWDRRGEIYIRFGPPDDRIDSTFDYNYEKWYYFSQNLKFMFTGGAQGLRLVPFVDFSGHVQSLPEYNDYRVRMESKGVLYSPPLGEVPLELALAWYPFRREDGNYDVYVACAVPARDIATRTRRPARRLDYTTRVVAFDSVLQSRWVDSQEVAQELPEIPNHSLAQSTWATVLPPGFYVVAAELDDHESSKRGVSTFDGWLVPHVAESELDLSPLVMAAEIRPAEPGSGPFVRNGREIIPRASNVFLDDQDIAFYHEVYNLRTDPDGQCRYRVEYALYDSNKRDRTTLMTHDYVSEERNTYQAGTIPASQLEQGTYILEAVTTDQVGKATRTALARIRIN
jgi:GWxTD domain-containing protein